MTAVQMNIQVHRYSVAIGRKYRSLYMTAPSGGGPLWAVGLTFMDPLPPWRGQLLPSKQGYAYLPLADFADSYHLVQTEDPVWAYIWVEDSDNSVFDAFLTTSEEVPGEGFADPRFTNSFAFPWKSSP